MHRAAYHAPVAAIPAVVVRGGPWTEPTYADSTMGDNADGEDLEGDALVAAQAARQDGLKIYTIGVGGRGEAPMPITDENGHTRLVMTKVDVDEAKKTIHLREPAKMNGNCMECHSTDDTLWRKVPDHQASLDDTRAGRLSCASEGCHGIAHPFFRDPAARKAQ